MKLQHLGIMAVAAVALLACNKGKEEVEEPVTPVTPTSSMTITPASTVMHYGDSLELAVTGADAPYTWSSDNEYNAQVTESGKVYGLHIGTTTVRAKKDGKEATCTIIVNPYSNMYAEPYFGWGQDTTMVKTKASGTYYSSTDSTLTYRSVYNSSYIVTTYCFKNDALSYVYVMMLYSQAMYSEQMQYLFERYQIAYIDKQTYTYYFINTTDVQTASMKVMWYPYTYQKSATESITYIFAEYHPFTYTPSSTPMRKMAMPEINFAL